MGAAALDMIFRELGLTEVLGEAIETNEGSIAFHRKLGFTQTDRRSGAAVKDGKPVDVVQFSIQKKDWLAARGKKQP